MNQSKVEFIRVLTPVIFGFFAVLVSVAGMITNNRDSGNIAAGFVAAAATAYLPQNRNQQSTNTKAETIENVTIEK